MVNKQQIFLVMASFVFSDFAVADHPTVAFGSEDAGPISKISAATGF